MQRKLSGRPNTGRPLSGLSGMARPITQQKLAGPRQLGTPLIPNRIHKDQRYYISSIQAHISLLQEEIINLQKKFGGGKIMSVTEPELKRVAEKLARKFAEKQELLNTYNNALDFHMSYIPRDKIIQDTENIRENNQRLINELENLQLRKIKQEEKLKELKKEFEEEEQFTKKLVESLNKDEKEIYLKISEANKKYLLNINHQQNISKNLKEKIDHSQKLITHNKAKKMKFTLLQNYHGLKQQHEALSKQVNEILTPENRKEMLLKQVKKNKADIETLTKTKNVLSEEMKEKKERLQIMEEELDNTNNKRLEKHKELRQRELVMLDFLNKFQDKRTKVIKDINEEQNKVIKFLEAMTISQFDLELNSLEFGTDYRKLSTTELMKHYDVFKARYSRLQIMKGKDEEEIKKKTEEKMKFIKELEELKDTDTKKMTLEKEIKIIQEDIKNVKNKLNATVAAVHEAQKKKDALEEQLNKSQEYKKIVVLEKNLEKITQQIEDLQNEIERDNLEVFVEKRIQEVTHLIESYNEKLKQRVS